MSGRRTDLNVWMWRRAAGAAPLSAKPARLENCDTEVEWVDLHYAQTRLLLMTVCREAGLAPHPLARLPPDMVGKPP